ncbi:hypothetical protein MPH_01627 [Macrophomina phaseolina MS6]|uniref:Uncharacterized protein n=1 Tax=Macrophomina phaseolina (strain MS6) TaxID=1126212 RepID=K2SX13_MACPH|nr:hypothetical protein MPH_01627 [Macrophomina phaseolina MS6]
MVHYGQNLQPGLSRATDPFNGVRPSLRLSSPQSLDSQLGTLDNGAPLYPVKLLLESFELIILTLDERDLFGKNGSSHIHFKNDIVNHHSGACDLTGFPVGMCPVNSVGLVGVCQGRHSRGCRYRLTHAVVFTRQSGMEVNDRDLCIGEGLQEWLSQDEHVTCAGHGPIK